MESRTKKCITLEDYRSWYRASQSENQFKVVKVVNTLDYEIDTWLGIGTVRELISDDFEVTIVSKR